MKEQREIDLIDFKIALLSHIIKFENRWFDAFNPFNIFRLHKHLRDFIDTYDGNFKQEVNQSGQQRTESSEGKEEESKTVSQGKETA